MKMGSLGNFEHADPRLVSIMEDLLEFNPRLRSDIKYLLKSKVFDEVRDPILEMDAPFKVDIEMEGHFDYKNWEFLGLTTEDLNHLLKVEIRQVKLTCSD